MFNNSCDVKERKCQLIKAATHIIINQIIKKLLLLEKAWTCDPIKMKIRDATHKKPQNFFV